MTIDFGVTRRQLMRATIVAAGLGAVALAVGVVAGLMAGTTGLRSGVIRVLPYFFGVAAILPSLLGTANILRLRIDGDEIVQMVGPWVASRRRLDQVAGVSIDGKLFPVTVRFRDGGRFRLLALHLADRARLVAVLSERVPGIEDS